MEANRPSKAIFMWNFCTLLNKEIISGGWDFFLFFLHRKTHFLRLWPLFWRFRDLGHLWHFGQAKVPVTCDCPNWSKWYSSFGFFGVQWSYRLCFCTGFAELDFGIGIKFNSRYKAVCYGMFHCRMSYMAQFSMGLIDGHFYLWCLPVTSVTSVLIPRPSDFGNL